MSKRISVSTLSAYMYCKRKLFLERVLGLFEPEKEALVKGTISMKLTIKLTRLKRN